ncbi:MAG: hypothetical protein SVZ03_10975 [Spirochaetota bacterium]|nr:hypothetical protein [Spirochaetota bacterium]
MKLAKEDLQLFYKLHPALLLFTNQEAQVIQNVNDLQQFWDLDINDKAKIRNELYNNIDIINKLYENNPFSFTERELRIVLDWKNYIKGEFIVYNQYKKYCAFTCDDDNLTKTYGVIGLSNSFDEIIEEFPILVKTVLLPFKNQIIYDGFFSPYSIYFGPNIRAELKEKYEVSKAKYGIIERLPFHPPSKHESNIGLLKLYLKNEANIEHYEYEIKELLESNKDLIEIYHQEYGKTHFKKHKKRLKELGISKGWFAVFDDTIIASGKTEEKVKEIINDLISNDKLGYITFFKMK